MSVVEELRAFKLRIAQRIEELEPLVAEYEELRRLASMLDAETGLVADATTRRTASGRAPKRGTKRRANARRTAPGGTRALGAQRRARILELVTARPGVTIAELTDDLRIDRTSVYRLVRKLREEGQIAKEGRGLKLA